MYYNNTNKNKISNAKRKPNNTQASKQNILYKFKEFSFFTPVSLVDLCDWGQNLQHVCTLSV